MVNVNSSRSVHPAIFVADKLKMSVFMKLQTRVAPPRSDNGVSRADCGADSIGLMATMTSTPTANADTLHSHHVSEGRNPNPNPGIEKSTKKSSTIPCGRSQTLSNYSCYCIFRSMPKSSLKLKKANGIQEGVSGKRRMGMHLGVTVLKLKSP